MNTYLIPVVDIEVCQGKRLGMSPGRGAKSQRGNKARRNPQWQETGSRGSTWQSKTPFQKHRWALWLCIRRSGESRSPNTAPWFMRRWRWISAYAGMTYRAHRCF